MGSEGDSESLHSSLWQHLGKELAEKRRHEKRDSGNASGGQTRKDRVPNKLCGKTKAGESHWKKEKRAFQEWIIPRH